VAQAQKIEIAGDRVTFTYAPAHRALRTQLDQGRAWLEPLAAQVAKRKMTVVSVEGSGPPPKPAGGKPAGIGPGRHAAGAGAGESPTDDLRKKALADPGVQAVLDVFAAEITKVEEI
jgi:hypothetical protein